MVKAWATAVLATLAACAAAQAQPQSGAPIPPEPALWQAIQADTDPASFRAFLFYYPHGQFAQVARERAGGKLPPQDPHALYRLTAIPDVALPGQGFIVSCVGFPQPALYDWIVVVPSGTPDFDPGGPEAGQALFSRLATTVTCPFGVTIPPQPPGAYEARYVSRAFNPDGRSEAVARVEFFSN